jgi:hypothetical protein
MTTLAVCNSYKQELLSGVHTSTDIYKVALIKAFPDYTRGAATTSAGSPGVGAPSFDNLGTDEVSPSGSYLSGGATLQGFTTSIFGSVATLDFDSLSFASATISASGALIYNASKENRAVAVIGFGTIVSSTNGAFTITMPAAGQDTSLIRLG